METTVQEERGWKEILRNKEDFQKIVRLLVDFDERTGKAKEYGQIEAHHMRRAVSVADAEHVRFFVQHMGGYVYTVVAELRCGTGFLTTAWTHEDGIKVERSEFAANAEHPVHRIVCLTDLYETASAMGGEELSLSGPTLDLMFQTQIAA